jgi:hypothetical protein
MCKNLIFKGNFLLTALGTYSGHSSSFRGLEKVQGLRKAKVI